jgi:GT2 family glycosyltransferase
MKVGSVSVVVPTYRRPAQLRRCLQGLRLQSRSPEEIVVIRRRDDHDALAVLSGRTGLRAVTVDQPGVLAAMAAGVREATGSIIVFTDDDAVPRRDWLDRLLGHFADPTVGAVGGRDIVHAAGEANHLLTRDVGRISAWGKMIGNHHLGTGPPREAMVLKGVNMAFRKEAVELPANLRGLGAQAHFEVASSLWARRHGWRLIYDPSAVVDHYPGPRFDADRRERPGGDAVRDGAYNLVFCLLTAEPHLYWRRALFGLVVGDRSVPGLARAAAGALRGEHDVVSRLLPSLLGQVQALVDIARGRRAIPLSAMRAIQ